MTTATTFSSERSRPAGDSDQSNRLNGENVNVVVSDARSLVSDFGSSSRSGGDEPAERRAADLLTTDAPVSSAVPATLQSSQAGGGGESNRPAVKISEDDIKTATLRKTAIEAYRKLVADGAPTRAAARRTGYPFHTIYNWCKAFDAEGFDGLLPAHKNSGRKPKHKFTEQQVNDVRALVLRTNRNATSGSVPEAMNAAMKLGLLDPKLTQVLKMRFENGAAVLTPSMREQIRIAATTTFASRAPRNAWLHFVQSPGSLMLTRDERTGEEREIQPCEKWTMDDGTINFVCCVPFNLPGNKCAENFGVMCGRFQFLLVVDHRSYFIPGFNYTARPRSSYRAEDLTATLHVVFAEHGFPKTMVLEHGVSAADLMTETLTQLGIKIERASSPHQKVVEFVFNSLWTKLSLMPGQVGRYRGEEEEIQALLGSCQRGATDPRKHFPMLMDVLKALREAVTDWNAHLVKSPQYGKWIPREQWEKFRAQNLRPLEQEQAWMFSPCSVVRKVQGFKARVSVPLMEGYSEVFDFSATWMHEYNGAQVKLFFNPFAAECVATVTLAENFKGKKQGTILGHAEQINRMARFRRRAFGYGADADIGLDATRRNAQALRRSVVAIRADGSTGVQAHEARNGVGQGEIATNDSRLTAPPVQRRSDRLRVAAKGTDDDEFERQAARLARAAELNQRQELPAE